MSIVPELATRIVCESQAVAGLFPGGFALRSPPHGPLYWTGEVRVEGRRFPVDCIYPAAYPAVPPVLATKMALPADCPHVLGPAPTGGRAICWISPSTTEAHRRWNPVRHTAATALGAAQRWFLALLVFQTLGVWPVDDAFQFGPRW